MGCSSSSAVQASSVQQQQQQQQYGGSSSRTAPGAPAIPPASASAGAPRSTNARSVGSRDNDTDGDRMFSSKAELEAHRAEFWDTRVEGDPLVWSTLRVAADAALGGDLGTAAAILSASGVSSPGGSLALCYDERGREYVVPAYCYQAPEKFIRDAAAPSSAPAENASSPQKQLPKVEANSQSPAAAIAPPSGACIKLKVCVCPGDFRLVVDTSLQETVATFQQRVSDAAAMMRDFNSSFPGCPVGRQRIIFMGKELKGSVATQTLSSVGVVDDSRVMQVFLRAAPN